MPQLSTHAHAGKSLGRQVRFERLHLATFPNPTLSPACACWSRLEHPTTTKMTVRQLRHRLALRTANLSRAATSEAI
jgi:hypothetical protein